MINPVLQVLSLVAVEMEDIGDDEIPERGVLPHPTPLAHAIPAHHVVECDRVAHRADPPGRPRVKRLRWHSQRETVPASSLSLSNKFAVALDSDTVLRHSEAHVVPSHVLGQSAGSNRVVVHMGTPDSLLERRVLSFQLKMIPVTVATRNHWQVMQGTPLLELEVVAVVPPLREAVIRAAIRSMDEVDPRGATFSQGTFQECFEIGIAHQKQRRGGSGTQLEVVLDDPKDAAPQGPWRWRHSSKQVDCKV